MPPADKVAPHGPTTCASRSPAAGPPAAEPITPLHDFLQQLLTDQQRLQTPVARFAALHDNGYLDGSTINHPPSTIHHGSLIPLTAPAPGEQYAFEVDLDSCTGCKACVAGCHSLNGLDDEETWRDTGLLVGGPERHPFQQTVTTACHHCADPGCLNGCPVLAYDKDPVTGIVRHLDDQCIGCSYCVLKCPYDVPKYSSRLGIVRKCDMCHSRLAAGEAPACVQACPTHAIKIVKVTIDPANRIADTSTFLSAAPDPSYTLPTTRYVSRRELPADLRPADRNTLRPQPAHWPLVLMLAGTQAAVGLHLAAVLAPAFAGESVSSASLLAGLALAFATAGLVASVAHLGRPLRAWRIFLGLRRSWLSREAVVFGAWFPALALAVLGGSLAPFLDGIAGLIPFVGSTTRLLTLATAAAVATGLIGVGCSAMIYVDTHRRAWGAAPTFPRFLGTVAIFAAAGVAVAVPRPGTATVFAVVLLAKLLLEARATRPLDDSERTDELTPGLATARLLTETFHRVLGFRWVAALAAGAVTLYATSTAPALPSLPLAGLALGLLLAGEIAERYLYFRTVDAPKMPGYAARPSAS